MNTLKDVQVWIYIYIHTLYKFDLIMYFIHNYYSWNMSEISTFQHLHVITLMLIYVNTKIQSVVSTVYYIVKTLDTSIIVML
jgi:hypothetical protein